MFFADSWNGNTLCRNGYSLYASRGRHEYKKIGFELDFGDIAQIIEKEYLYLIDIGFSLKLNPQINLDEKDRYSNLLRQFQFDYKIALAGNDIDVLFIFNIHDGKFGFYSVHIIKERRAQKAYSSNISLENIKNRIEISSYEVLEKLKSEGVIACKEGNKPELQIFPLQITCPICGKGHLEFINYKQKLKCTICRTRLSSQEISTIQIL